MILCQYGMEWRFSHKRSNINIKDKVKRSSGKAKKNRKTDMLLIKGDDSGEFVEFPNIEKHYQIHSFYKKLSNNEQNLKNIEHLLFDEFQDLNLPFTQEDIQYHFDMIKYEKLFQMKCKKKKLTLFGNNVNVKNKMDSDALGRLINQQELTLIYCICQTKTKRNKNLIFDLLKLDKILELKLYSYDSFSFPEKLPVLQKTIIRHYHIFTSRSEWLFDYLDDFHDKLKRYKYLINELEKTGIQLMTPRKLKLSIDKEILDKYYLIRDQYCNKGLFMSLLDEKLFYFMFIHYHEHVKDLERQKNRNEEVLNELLNKIKSYYNRCSSDLN